MAHFHIPKPLHGWREFAGEVGIIVLGVLIALAAEQAVQAIHHRIQARDMAKKLREESLRNREIIAFDIARLKSSISAVDEDITAVSGSANQTGGPPQLSDLPARFRFLRPADAAWISVRESALLPIIPQKLVDNYWKVDVTVEILAGKAADANRAVAAAQALIDQAKAFPTDGDVTKSLFRQLSELKQLDESLLDSSLLYQRVNERALEGKNIDALHEANSVVR